MGQKKEYRSAIRSRRMIRDAFRELLKEKNYEKITVTDIVTRADLNRSTFYAHYPDVQGVVDAMMEDVLDRSLSLVAGLESQSFFSDPLPFVHQLMAIGMENIELYRLLGKSDVALQQIDKVKALMIERILASENIPEQIRKSTAFRIRISFFIGGILNIYQEWIRGGMECSMDEIVEQVAMLIANNAESDSDWMTQKSM